MCFNMLNELNFYQDKFQDPQAMLLWINELFNELNSIKTNFKNNKLCYSGLVIFLDIYSEFDIKFIFFSHCLPCI